MCVWRKGFVYLAAVLDAFPRKVIGWALDDHLEASLAIEALDMAISARDPKPDTLVHHSDRDVQYAPSAYVERLMRRKISASMSRPGNPYDNAKAESFTKTLKSERSAAKPTPVLRRPVSESEPSSTSSITLSASIRRSATNLLSNSKPDLSGELKSNP